MSVVQPGDQVLVTGATGFIATHLIKQLQEKGYRVRATVRSLTKDPKLIEKLRSLASNPRFPLELVEADLLKDAGWDAAVAGCVGVFHVAASVRASSPNPKEEILDPSLDGVRRVYEAAERAKIVKKIVLTSSVAAVLHAGVDGRYFTEADWNKDSTLANAPYPYAKTEAEKWAWAFLKREGAAAPFQMNTINPSLVLGPALTPQASSSLEVPVRFLTGAMPMAPHMGWGVVDVRDVARAHILAMESAVHGERFFTSGRSVWMLEIADAIRKDFPNYPVPVRTCPGFLLYLVAMWDAQISWAFLNANINVMQTFNTEKSQKVLGLTYLPFEKTIRDTVEGLVEVGLVPRK
jgi:dihydroflavonol-4-reductase